MESVRVCVVNSSRALECVRERRGEREQAGWQWMVLGQDQAIKRQASAGRLAKKLSKNSSPVPLSRLRTNAHLVTRENKASEGLRI